MCTSTKNTVTNTRQLQAQCNYKCKVYVLCHDPVTDKLTFFSARGPTSPSLLESVNIQKLHGTCCNSELRASY